MVLDPNIPENSSILLYPMASGERLALSPTINVDNTWLASRTNDTPHDVLVAVVDLLMLGKCPAWTQEIQYAVHVSSSQKDIRYESEVSRTQILSLVAALADNRAIAGV
jgi:hypothetical protein